jgi:hypothetical protein
MQSFTPMLTNCAPAGWQVKMGLMVPMRDFSLISQAMMISFFSLVRGGASRRGCTRSSAESVPRFPIPPRHTRREPASRANTRFSACGGLAGCLIVIPPQPGVLNRERLFWWQESTFRNKLFHMAARHLTVQGLGYYNAAHGHL